MNEVPIGDKEPGSVSGHKIRLTLLQVIATGNEEQDHFASVNQWAYFTSVSFLEINFHRYLYTCSVERRSVLHQLADSKLCSDDCWVQG